MLTDLPIPGPTTRFSNRAENYVKYRPGYPPELIHFFENNLGLKKNARIADIGSGTGLFAEPLLQKGYSVVCIEPNEEMRKAGQERLSQFPNFISRDRTAEATGLRNNSVELITVAQAFHWLDLLPTKMEFERILKPGGHIVLAWNTRIINSPFMENYATLKKQFNIDPKVPDRIDLEKIAAFFEPGEYEQTVFPNSQLLDFDALKGQTLSSSYMPLPGHPSYETMISSLVQLFVAHNENGFVRMEFETRVFWNKAV